MPSGCWVIWGLAGGSLLFATSQGVLTRNPTRGFSQKSRHRQQAGRATRLPAASRSLKKWVAVQGSHWNGFTMRNVGWERCLTRGNSTALHLNSPDRNRNEEGTEEDNGDPQMGQGLVGQEGLGLLNRGETLTKSGFFAARGTWSNSFDTDVDTDEKNEFRNITSIIYTVFHQVHRCVTFSRWFCSRSVRFHPRKRY